jgi:tyrosyl-tRNA synthetase
MDPEPTTTSPEPQLSNSAETSPDDYVKQQQSESTNRLKPLTQRRLNRIAHMKKKASFSPRPTISDTATTRRVTPEQHCLETINTMSSMSSSTFSSIPKTHISKASVMEFYLKEKLRESSIREFEMMLNNT